MKKILFYHLPTNLTVLVIFSILSTAVFAPILAWSAAVVDLGMAPVSSIIPKQQVKSAVSKKIVPFIKIQHTPNVIKEKTGQSIIVTAEAYQTSGVRSVSLYIKNKLVKTCTPPNDSLTGSCVFTGTNYPAGSFTYKAKATTVNGEVWSSAQNFVVQEGTLPVITTYNLPANTELFFPGDTTNWEVCGSDASGIKEIKMFANDKLFKTYKNVSSGDCQTYNYNITTTGLVRAYVTVADNFDNLARWPQVGYFEFNVSSPGYTFEGSWTVAPDSRLAVDNQGNIYVANNNIKKYNSTGNLISTITNDPYASHHVVAVDGEGYIYSIKTPGVVKLDQQGNEILNWGSLGDGNGQFRYPSGIAVDSASNIYVIEKASSRVQKFTNEGVFVRSFNLGSQNRYLSDIWVNQNGYIYLRADGGFVALVLNSNGNIIQRVNNVGIDAVNITIVADAQNNFYLNGSSPAPQNDIDYRVFKYNLQGQNISRFGERGTAPGQFTQIFDAVIDSQGNLYVINKDSGLINKFRPEN